MSEEALEARGSCLAALHKKIPPENREEIKQLKTNWFFGYMYPLIRFFAVQKCIDGADAGFVVVVFLDFVVAVEILDVGRCVV